MNFYKFSKMRANLKINLTAVLYLFEELSKVYFGFLEIMSNLLYMCALYIPLHIVLHIDLHIV